MFLKSTIYLLITCLFLASSLQSQNLVPNPSFENYIGSLPCSWSPVFSNTMEDWTNPSSASPDIFSMLVGTSCYAHCLSTHSGSVGQQLPHTGDLMTNITTYGIGCGFAPDYRDFLQVQLIEPLMIGKTYYAEMYISHCDLSMDASNNIGLYFSEDAIISSVCMNFEVTPQINETNIITEYQEWVKVSGTFVATTAAQYMTVGNFYSNADTEIVTNPDNDKINARYFVDDFYVVSFCGTLSNTLEEVCLGDPFTLYGSAGQDNIWVNIDAPTEILSTEDSLVVDSAEMTTYILYSGCDTVVTMIDLFTVDTDVILIDDSLIVSATNATFQWLDCGNGMTAVAGATDAGFMPEFNGRYAVSVTQNGCTAVSDCYDVMVLSTFDLNKAERPLVYPNPTSSNAYISFDHLDVMNIIVYDETGCKILQTEVNQKGEIDLLPFPAGLYIVIINTGEMTWTERVLKL